METNGTNLTPLNSDFTEKNNSICILGTGDFGRSLGYKLLQCGFHVIFGSRNPAKASLLLRGVEVLGHAEAAQKCPIIIVAVQRDHYDPFLKELEDVLDGKVIVDISNNLKIDQYPESNAEYLAQMLPGAKVVKAFNTVSAWSLQSGTLDASRQVFVCSDDNAAKQKVIDIVRAIGLTPQDKGSLLAAKEIENYPLQLFPMWRLPIYLCAGLTVLVFIYCYSRFPNWLDRWMLCRKQLGLVALSYAFLHAIYTLVIPIRYYVRHRIATNTIAQARGNETSPFQTVMAWRTDLYIALGILGFFFYVLLGITSLPSVSNAVNWREFRFVQSKLGYLTLVLCTGHAFVFGWNKFLNVASFRWSIPPAYTLSLVIPCIVLILKFVLIIPCVDNRITKIRQGWERHSTAQADKKFKNGDIAL
uniref:Metalloreductase STEAP4 n=1 Tax=Pyxicephalus adspersus TaxID=30357 RepID=A0AAV3AF68_PYXAD|nr:TPA: hypothetical protein GDO54_012768 [Pyxicephalus adspersus]